jgi:hypothetical protein
MKSIKNNLTKTHQIFCPIETIKFDQSKPVAKISDVYNHNFC